MAWTWSFLLVGSWVAVGATLAAASLPLPASERYDSHLSEEHGGGVAYPSHCICRNKSHCNFVDVGERQEVLGWSTYPKLWRHYDWEKITTIAVFRDWDTWSNDTQEMLCVAHSKQVRVVLVGIFGVANLSKPAIVDAWIQKHLAMAEMYGADGINIDIEQPILKGSKDNERLVSLVQRTRDTFKRHFPHSQVSFDVAWSADCVDNRCYDAKGLADATDFLALMSYDEQGQIYPPHPCVAGANSGLQQTIDGINTYLNLGISSSKLVLGMPWYGYDYTCIHADKSETLSATAGNLERKAFEVCPMTPVPYQGAPCSDAAGKQREYHWVMRTLRENSTDGGHWDDTSMSPYYEFLEFNGMVPVRHQVWYDNPASLELKYELVKKMQLRGLAFWGVDFLDYEGSEVGKLEAKVMWDVVDARL